MKKTLKEIMYEYDGVKTIQIQYGKHIVNIDTRVEGSYSLIKHLYDVKYTVVAVSYTVNHILLSI